ncbi:MAG: long-chain fatty acid--CoA ligase [Deltaproteobacteria bacterium]|nr:long-chain fatty acid--CoA ligase [Deltaproteobacteria bacterium]MCB9788710.1 long-chain fatty acid--CoA ligase [Deltaproteobacteria bacterium]
MADVIEGRRTLLELFEARAAVDPQAIATRHQSGDAVVETTWADWDARSRALAAGFVAMGVAPGDRVAVMARTRVEWAWLDLAIHRAGAVAVPIFPTEVAANCAFMLEDSGARLVVVEDPVQARKLVEMRERLLAVERVVWMDGVAEGADGQSVALADVIGEDARWFMGFDALLALGERNVADLGAEVARRSSALRPADLATIHYTPGTEGRPKGVVLTHGNLLAVSRTVASVLPLDATDVQLLYLPLALPFARLSLAVSVVVGATTAFGRSHRTILEDCRVFRPTFLCGVPRLFERVRNRRDTLRRNLPGPHRWALDWAVGAAGGADAGGGGMAKLSGLRRRVAQKLAYEPLREMFGGRLRFAISGGAPLGAETGQFFRAHGIEVLEGYGMTETAGCTHLNRIDDNVPGTGGTPLPGVSCRIAEDGEILLRGPMVFNGYWERPQASADALDDGWLKTGDLGSVDADGHLRITGRKREVIITLHGKAIAPQPLSEALTSDALISQALIHGDGRSFLSALITLDRDGLEDFARESGIVGSYEELARHPVVFEAVERIIARVNANVGAHEAIRKFAILASPLTAEQGEVTSTQRIRRRVASERHRALLDSFYSEQY